MFCRLNIPLSYGLELVHATYIMEDHDSINLVVDWFIQGLQILPRPSLNILVREGVVKVRICMTSIVYSSFVEKKEDKKS
jgi:hypothetical protein